jgi:hypothetical protein
MKPESIAIGVVTLLLVVYTTFASLNVFLGFVFLTASLSPLLIIWMVWVVIKHGEYRGPELKENQEYGYLDKLS